VLARPLLLADPKAHAAACAQCDELLAAMLMPDRTASEVRALLEQAGPPFPDFEAVARALGASSRTIRRRLDAEGVSFRVLLDEVRLGLAKRWLARGDRPITAIGLELGYADSANFTRAFRRAFGQSPLAYQRGLRDPE
jgi:AraC-like DNA-binding protein